MKRVLIVITIALLLMTSCKRKEHALIYDENDRSTWWYEGHTRNEEEHARNNDILDNHH